MGRQRPALCRLGDLPHQGIAGRSEPDLRLAVQRLVRADHPALRRRRQDLAPAGHARRRADHARRHAEGESNKFVYDTADRQAADHAPVVRRHAASWEFKRVWHLEPSLTDPDTVYAGVEDAAIFRSTDGGKNWNELPGLRGHGTGPKWQPGAGGMCLHTILLDPEQSASASTSPSPRRALSAPTTAAKTWKPINQRPAVAIHSRPRRRGRPLRPPHRACTRSRPDVLFMQKHWDVMRTDDAGDNWTEVSGNLPTDFGFAIDVHAHEPETIYVVPIKSDSEHYPPEGKLRVYRSRTGGNEWEPLTKGLPQKDCYVNVLRDAMAVDSLDQCGIYFGTTGGQVYASADARRQLGRRSCAICRRCCRWRCRP